jgi:hypothetical protein
MVYLRVGTAIVFVRRSEPYELRTVSSMKIALILIAVVLVVISFVADYKWRKWMADRKRDRQQ